MQNGAYRSEKRLASEEAAVAKQLLSLRLGVHDVVERWTRECGQARYAAAHRSALELSALWAEISAVCRVRRNIRLELTHPGSTQAAAARDEEEGGSSPS